MISIIARPNLGDRTRRSYLLKKLNQVKTDFSNRGKYTDDQGENAKKISLGPRIGDREPK